MAFRKAADGITKQGKTKGRNLGDDGAKVAIQTGPKASGSKGGKTNADMKDVFYQFNMSLVQVDEGVELWSNEKEIQRLKEKGVLKSIENASSGFKIISDNSLIISPGKYIRFKNTNLL